MIALALALTAAAASPALDVVPRHARPGDAFLVVVRGAAAASGTAAGRDLAFFPGPSGQVAVAGLPVETPAGPLAVTVRLEPPGAASDGGLSLGGTLEVTPPEFPHRELAVQREYVAPPAPEVQRRIDEDRAAFARAFAQPGSAPLFRGPFAWPRRARVTADYGEQRTLNGVKPSQHYGLDLAGRVGAPVVASNDGRVVLVRDCWASGRSVVLWHGAGLYTTYFHLSRAAVAEGELVRRGQRLGLVGATGRVSGPHLHWGVRVGDLYVDPRSVLRLRWPW
jgi:murein DD-endopeptidase MepM/ murein hydrolase activator NlpD